MERPCILLSASRSGWQNYENAVLRAGGSVAGGYCPQPDAGYDGLLLCGGEDIDPDRYGQKNCGSLGIDPDRDAAEFVLAEAYAAAGKPIFGICRGHQVLNVVLGGSLLQDLGPEWNLFHRRTPGTDVDRIHPLRTEENSLLRRLYGPVFSSNRSHHQAVDRLGDGLRLTAWSEVGIAESLEHETLPLFSVQFHPERMSYAMRRPDAADGALLFEWFIRLCADPIPSTPHLAMK